MRIQRHPDQTQILTVRLLTGAVALAASIKLLYFLPMIVAQYEVVPLGIFIFGLVGEFAFPLLGGLMAFGGGLRLLRWVNGGTALGHVLVTALSFALFATTDNSLTPPWIFVASGAATAAAIGWGRRGVFLLVGLALVSLVELPFTVFAGTEASFTVSAGIQMVVGMAIFGGLALAVVASSRLLDSAASDASAAVAGASTRRARQVTSLQSDAIMHDDILGTLLFGAENNPLFRRAVAAQATRALSEIDNLSAVSVTTDSVSISTFEAQASEIVHHLDPNARMVTSAVSDDHIPAAAAVAMLGALTQAVTNSVIHAGAGGGAVQRMVTFTGASRELNIRIHDNGVGFNPSSVPSTRLGIRSSIHGRMNSIPGCFSTVESTPGSGTTVDLRWQPVRESPAEIGERSAPPQLNAASLRVVRIVVGIFAVGQVLLCALSSVSTGNVLGSIVALIALSAPIIFLVKRHYVVDATVVTFVVVGVLVAASMLFFQGADAEGGHAEVWFLDSGAVLLMVLLYSGHGRLAWGLMGVVAAIFLVDSLSQQSGGGPEFGLIVRPIALLLTATLLSVPLKMFQPRINALRAESRRILGEKIFVAATTAQRQSEAVRLQSLAGPLLQTLARSEELTHSQVAECVALEGLLRDQARGNRLSRGELKRAAGRARTRGIDVMLLDDSDGEGVTDSDILTITNWMSEHLEKITEGQFVGRVLPTGRPDMATIVMSGNSGPLRMSLSR